MNKIQNQLIKEIEKRCTTLMIGSVARFEDNFGYLWANDGPHREGFDQLWYDTRHDVLNFGNHQIRSIVEDLFRHFLDEKNNELYHYELKMDAHKQGDK